MMQRLLFWLAGGVGSRLLGAMLGTARMTVENETAWREQAAAGRPVLFTCWHGRLLPLAYCHRGQSLVALVSRSADGEYITRVLQGWGFDAVRGSSSRGGDVAFRELVRLIRSGRSIAITPDGPRGPREEIKPGVLQLAQLSGAPIVLVAGAASRAWWFESWDRFLVPQPFCRIRVAYADPLFVPRSADTALLGELKTSLEATMADLMARVEANV